MLTVRDLMQTDLVSVAPDLSLRNLVDLLAQRHLSGAPVRSGQRLVGVVSASDILSFLASEPPVPAAQVPASEAEPGEPEEADPVEEWEDGSVTSGAYFTDLWDDVGADLQARFRRVSGSEWDLLDEHTVDEAMTRAVVAIPPGAPVRDAARAMVERRLHRLLVVEQGNLLGILTTSDLVRAVAEGRLGAGEVTPGP